MPALREGNLLRCAMFRPEMSRSGAAKVHRAPARAELSWPSSFHWPIACRISTTASDAAGVGRAGSNPNHLRIPRPDTSSTQSEPSVSNRARHTDELECLQWTGIPTQTERYCHRSGLE
jgi:hypothetical protein